MNSNLRKVRSFVRRPGRITAAQERALDTLLPRWGLDQCKRRIEADKIYGRSAPRVLDLGFGDGEALVTSAANHVEADFLGVEVHEPGVGHLLILLEQAGLDNVRVVVADGVEVVADMLGDASFDVINLFFPDPWPKKRHHKRRIVQPDFVADCARILKVDGFMHVATDWANYAEHVTSVFDQSPYFAPENETMLANEPLAMRPPTKFERRGRKLGHEVVDLFYRRVSGTPASR